MEILSKYFSQIKKIPKEYFLPIGMGCFGLILIAYGLIQYFHSSQPQERVDKSVENAQHYTVKTVKNMKVDIEGAVQNPGVYSLQTDSRLQDGLIAAGGMSAQADRDYVEKHINLASKLTDGIKIYIPRTGENILTEGAQTAAPGGIMAEGSININTASESDLDALPGIGLTTAEKIIAGRPYESTQDLLTKKIVGQKVYDQIKDKIIAF